MHKTRFSTLDIFNLVLQTHHFKWDIEYGVYFFELLEDIYNGVSVDLAISILPNRFKIIALVFELAKNRGVSKEDWVFFMKDILGNKYNKVIAILKLKRSNANYI